MKTMSRYMSLTLMASFTLSGCNMLTGGPSDADIEAAAREQMIAGAGPARTSAAFKTAFESAKIEPQGMCNSKGEAGKYVCTVEITSTPPGQTQEVVQSFIVKLSKDSDGKWGVVED